ncbi:ComE operon protein 3 [Candidatus Phycosocius bacilliformis]|uniref:ComE operon protein 3 n=1 Tax=Candidatus Phycosocius bacilliformis TaxID=1445552 RepID=A0A2P2EBD8_9PROT|nr:ComEC/Rec2 family competence protein [Candidatus Phycosocius bacilliformis]GBF58372.1 ComE operon protein 3 [Candidatus Phycosocius bacilliformis]
MAIASGRETNSKTGSTTRRGDGRLITRPREGESRLRIWLGDRLQNMRAQEADRLILWLPVAFAFGAGMGCSVRADDPVWAWVSLTLVALALWLGMSLGTQRLADTRIAGLLSTVGLFALLSAAFLGGGASGLLRAQAVAAPIVVDTGKPQIVTGFVQAIDRTQAEKWRALIVVETVEGLKPSDQPHAVRLALAEDEPPKPGQQIRCMAMLRPPPGPVVPGAYDHSRRAWFQGLGGVGYALKPCLVVSQPSSIGQKAGLQLAEWRSAAARHIVEVTEGHGGGFLAAVATGDRAWLSQSDSQALQTAGLSHVISVSGLHVGLLGGLIYLLFWRLIALVPPVALRFDARKIAAIAALAFTLTYCVFTGAEAPAVRAFIMSAIAYGAILLNRKAISMRGLAIAAMCVLMTLPESAIDPGFQMSFLATAGLVALWEAREGQSPTGPRPIFPTRIVGWFGAAAATSLVAGLATAPVSAATFGRVAPWSLPANVLAAPILDFWVAPLATLAAILAPFRLDAWAWQGAANGLAITLDLAHWVADLPGANARIGWTGSTAPIILILAVLWLCLWRSQLRFLAIIGFVFGFGLWAASPRPVAWIGPEGRAILATPSTGDASLCRTSGGRFDANRLIDAAGLDPASHDRLLSSGQFGYARQCQVGEGDWQARYVYGGRGRGILALDLRGQSHVFGPGDIPDGALLMRAGWRVYFYDIPSRKGPWVAQARGPSAQGEPMP